MGVGHVCVANPVYLISMHTEHLKEATTGEIVTSLGSTRHNVKKIFFDERLEGLRGSLLRPRHCLRFLKISPQS